MRSTQDPQLASKQLVDHALARFSTDNLSCMIVRFDSKAMQNVMGRNTTPGGVQGEPPPVRKSVSETEKIVGDAKTRLSTDAGKTDDQVAC